MVNFRYATSVGLKSYCMEAIQLCTLEIAVSVTVGLTVVIDYSDRIKTGLRCFAPQGLHFSAH